MPTSHRTPVSHALAQIGLKYGTPDILHEHRLYWNPASLPTDPTSFMASWAAVFAEVLFVRFHIYEWTLKPFATLEPIPVPFGTSVVGTYDGSGFKSESLTMTVSGRGAVAVAGDGSGKARAEWFVGGIPNAFIGGMKYATNASFGPLSDYIAWLNDPANNITNIYGQSASFVNRASLKFNSEAQESWGL